MKLTPQRQCVFGLLDGNTRHPTAETIYEAARKSMPTISMKTVYTILHELTEMGEIASLEVGTGALRFDPTTSGHHHLVCRVCGEVNDVHGIDTGSLRIPKAEKSGFAIDQTEVVFRGICEGCQARQS